MEEIKINDFLINAEDLQINYFESKPTGNKLRKIKFNTTIVGKANKNKLLEILKQKVFKLTFLRKDIEIEVKEENPNIHSVIKEENENTSYSFKINVNELDKDLPKDWNWMAKTTEKVINNWIEKRALSEILIDKGLITNKEYVDKINEIGRKDYTDMVKYIKYGIKPNKKE